MLQFSHGKWATAESQANRRCWEGHLGISQNSLYDLSLDSSDIIFILGRDRENHYVYSSTWELNRLSHAAQRAPYKMHKMMSVLS